MINRDRWTMPEGRPSEGRMEPHIIVDSFIEAVIRVGHEYGFSISHEDGQGAFEIEPYNEQAAEWLRNAHYIKGGGGAN